MNSVSSGPSARESHVENSKQDELRLLINSRSPIITIETAEEERLQGLLQKIAEQLLVPLYVWSVTTGIERAGGAPIYNTAAPEQALANIAEIKGDAMFLLRDFARYCENDRISRRLRDLVDSFRTSRRSIVFSGALIELPPELRGDSVPFQLGLPSASELLPCVNQVLAETAATCASPWIAWKLRKSREIWSVSLKMKRSGPCASAFSHARRRMQGCPKRLRRRNEKRCARTGFSNSCRLTIRSRTLPD